jgi:hypothetical protein
MHQGKLLFHRPTDQLLETTKRIRSVLQESNGHPPMVTPPGTVHQQIRGREWIVTVENFSIDQVEFIRSKNNIQQADVIDMTLDDVFRDYVRTPEEVLS